MRIDTSKLKLTHWVPKVHVEKVLTGNGFIVDKRETMKPAGIWLSVNNGWEDWCSSEMPSWIGESRECLEAKLKSGLKLFVIKTYADFKKEWLKCFQRKYKEGFFSIFHYFRFNIFLHENYDGVYLTKSAFWEGRMKCLWIYPWDCESVVVFNKDNVIFRRRK